jgi:hypothetical protein
MTDPLAKGQAYLHNYYIGGKEINNRRSDGQKCFAENFENLQQLDDYMMDFSRMAWCHFIRF